MSEHALRVEDLHITFGDRVRRLRMAVGMTQDEFGSAIDYSGAAVGRWELMGHTPRSSKRIISAVQLRFGVDAADFLRGNTSNGPSVRQSTDYRTLGLPRLASVRRLAS